MKSLLSSTGQLSRLHNAGICFLLALLPSSGNHFARQWAAVGAVVEAVAAACFVIFLCGGFVWVWRIRCPKCGLRWFFYAIRTEPIGEWLPWLKSFSACPKCGLSSVKEHADAHAA